VPEEKIEAPMLGCQRFGAGANRLALLALRDAERIRRVRPQILDVAILCTTLEDEATSSWSAGTVVALRAMWGQSCPVLREEIPVNGKQIRVGIVGADTKASRAKVSQVPAINGLSEVNRYGAASSEPALSSMKKRLFNTSERVHALHRNASAVSDPAFTPFVSASVDEIRYAQWLRDRLRERYPNRPSLLVSYWSVGGGLAAFGPRQDARPFAGTHHEFSVSSLVE
jgi:hypothetical protein